jgi:hypothetical protein
MKKVQHMVLLKFKASTPPNRIADLYAALARLKETMPGMLHCSGGAYSSPEGMNWGFTHGLLVTFSDAAARNLYLTHADHERIKQEFLPLVDNVIAFDFEE